MNEEERSRYQASLADYLRRRVNRAQLLKAAGAAGLAVAAAPAVAEAAATPTNPTQQITPVGFFQAPFFPQVGPGQTYQTELIQDIFSIALTAEHLAVTVLTNALTGPNALTGLNPQITGVLQAALVEEVDHVNFLESLGVRTLTDSFSVPSTTFFADPKTFFANLETAETIFVAAYMTAVRETAELGQPTVAKWAYQIGAVEAEHRALARAAQLLLGVTTASPPNNKSFETDMFLYLRDAARLLTDLGFLGTGPLKLAYPGTAAALTAAGPMVASVIQRTPNNATSSVTSTAASFTAAIETVTTTLLGSNDVPPGDPNGRGTAVVTLDAVNNQVCFTLTVTGLSSPATAAHIHRAPAGQEGPVVVPLTAPTTGTSSGCTPADAALIRDILANRANYYVNVHSKTFPGGAVRGQLG